FPIGRAGTGMTIKVAAGEDHAATRYISADEIRRHRGK
ncbi:MAG: hypothetical protein RLZ98_2959, partial [Pseudomonadota bacterium]